MDSNKCQLKTQDLSKNCRPSFFKFASTAEIEPLKGIIGQDRAVRSLSFALDIDNEGYNIYLAGYFGTGKTTLALEMMAQKANLNPVPADWCYVNNFKNIESPRALSLAAGMGQEFKKDVAANMDIVLRHIANAFEGQEFDVKKTALLNQFMEATNQIYMHLEEEARTYGFTISRTPNVV
ncbi:MAG: AAA family ATPase, partial [Firmicutes bacterium]|nr:AAA family ATPase [Bacillota bacterium]